jgi:hypothetical protein
MIKDIEKIVYQILSTSPVYLALDPKPEIYQQIAPIESDDSSIIINSIKGRSTKLGARFEVFQFSIWDKKKNDIFPIREAIAEIFNRYRGPDIIYGYEESTTPVYDQEVEQHGLHMTYVFKLYDPNY